LSRPILDSLRQPSVTFGDGEAGRSLFAFAEGLGFLLPLLGTLPVFFGIPTIRHDTSISMGDSAVAIPTARDFIKTKRLQNRAAVFAVSEKWTPNNCARRLRTTGRSRFS
jgi:hypothetical protein